jgi:hypothetical protein
MFRFVCNILFKAIVLFFSMYLLTNWTEIHALYSKVKQDCNGEKGETWTAITRNCVTQSNFHGSMYSILTFLADGMRYSISSTLEVVKLLVWVSRYGANYLQGHALGHLQGVA